MMNNKKGKKILIGLMLVAVMALGIIGVAKASIIDPDGGIRLLSPLIDPDGGVQTFLSLIGR